MKVLVSIAVRAAALLCVVVLCQPSAWATTKTWSGAMGDGFWGTPGNWSPSGVPGSSDSVTIGAFGSCELNVVSATVSSLVIQSGGELTLSPGIKLTVSGTTNIIGGGQLVTNGSDIEFDGAVTLDGSIFHSGGVIDGSGSLSIGSSATFQFLGSAGSSILELPTNNAG